MAQTLKPQGDSTISRLDFENYYVQKSVSFYGDLDLTRASSVTGTSRPRQISKQEKREMLGVVGLIGEQGTK